MATEAELINQIVEEAMLVANEFVDQVDTATDHVLHLSGVNVVGGGINSGYHIPVTEIVAIEPDVPAVDDSLLTYDAQLNNLVGLLSGELAVYFNTYYPLTSDAFDPATNWLINTITNGGTGIPAAVEAQIWQRSRDRILRDGARLEASIVTGFSAKGFSLAPGMLVDDIKQARYEQHGKIGEASTDIASKQADIQIETIKFAVGAALDSRFKAMNAASDYIRSLMSAPDAASRLASLNTDAKAKMMAATSDMYRARLSRDELVIRSQTDRMQTSAQFAGTILDAKQAKINGEVTAAAAAAEAYSKIAVAKMSTVNGIVGMSSSSFA